MWHQNSQPLGDRTLQHPHTWFQRVQFAGLGIVSTVLLGLGLTSCQPSTPKADSDLPQVVATSTILADLTETIGGDEIQLTGLLQPGADPHVYEPVPQDSLAMEKADLILYNGFNLEPGLIKLMNGAGVGARKLAVGEVVTPLDFEYQGQREPDPHVWGDVENAIAMVETIRDALIKLSPEDADTFTANADRLIAELRQLDTWVINQIATIPPDQRRLVTTHDAFQYYAHAYGLEVIGTLIGISTEEQPSAQTVQRLVDAVKAANVPAIFAETTINPALITTVAQESGTQLASNKLYSDSIGAQGSDGDTYINMIVANTRTIVESLQGTYTPFEPQP